MTDTAHDASVEEVDWEDSPTISLEDADGNTSRFEMLAILEVDEAAYAVLTPLDTDTDDATAPLEIQILHYDESDNGTFTLRSVEDDSLAAHLFDVVSETLTQAAEE
jgi:uncharacterized protein YrzB (UPF0473 family)